MMNYTYCLYTFPEVKEVSIIQDAILNDEATFQRWEFNDAPTYGLLFQDFPIAKPQSTTVYVCFEDKSVTPFATNDEMQQKAKDFLTNNKTILHGGEMMDGVHVYAFTL